MGRGSIVVLGLVSLGVTSLVQAEGEPEPARPSPHAVEALGLLDAEDPYQRQLGFLRLEALREASTATAIQPYVHHKDPDMRGYALRALAAIEGVKAIPLLLEALRTEKQSRVRRAALLGLEPLQRHDPAVLPAFIKALRDKNTEVRMTAVDIVSRIDEPAARDAIRVRSKRERRRDVRRVLELAVRRIGQP